jgi:hypothetical protein
MQQSTLIHSRVLSFIFTRRVLLVESKLVLLQETFSLSIMESNYPISIPLLLSSVKTKQLIVMFKVMANSLMVLATLPMIPILKAYH